MQKVFKKYNDILENRKLWMLINIKNVRAFSE